MNAQRRLQQCRICQTDRNLKYTPKEVRELIKLQRNSGKKMLRISTTTCGNICNDCDERLHNFHQENEDSDVELEVDVVGIQTKPGLSMYDLFRRSLEDHQHNDNLQHDARLDSQITLGSDGDTEIIDLLTSRESTPPSVAESYGEPKIVAIIDLVSDQPEETLPLPLKPSVSKDTSLRQKHSTSNKTYFGSEILLSNDSETEENKPLPQLPEKAPISTTQMPLPNSKSPPISHKCPVCECVFVTCARLIYHMRSKHRSYDDDETLSEQSRCAQDSAMTIRLRYMKRCTYYECQLCGRIDAAFKDHKQHVIQKHRDESKSLNDPMMKEDLKCPLCKVRCGKQFSGLCRHLLSAHSPAELQLHLNELTQLHTTGWSTEQQSQVTQAARVFQFIKHKGYYFQCRRCQNVVASVQKLLRHSQVGCHHILPGKKAPVTRSASLSTHKARATALLQSKSKNTHFKASDKKPKNGAYPKNKSKIKSDSTTNNNTITIKSKNISTTKNNNKNKANIVQNSAEAKTDKSFKRSQKVGKKVTTKPLKFTCEHCKIDFVGFIEHNRHVQEMHTDTSNDRCGECGHNCSSDVALQSHALQCRGQQKRERKWKCKQAKQPTRMLSNVHGMNGKDDATYKDECESQPLPNNNHKETQHDWLNDLYTLYLRRTNPKYICNFCPSNFDYLVQLATHEAWHNANGTDDLLKCADGLPYTLNRFRPDPRYTM